MALGGSTNAVLHLLAIANEARVDLELDDFNRVAARVPHIADMKPRGKFHMTDLDRIGGVPVVMKQLLDAGLLHGDCITVTGKTDGREPGRDRPARPRRRGRAPARRARSTPMGGIAVLTGSLAPQGLGGEGGRHRRSTASRARPGCSTARRRRMEAILAGQIEPGDVLVIRYEGPKGGPGMREMLAVTGALKGAGRGARLRPHHRRPLLRRHARVLHRSRRARGGRRRADRVRRATATASSSTCTPSALDLLVDDAELASAAGAAGSCPNPPRYTTGVLAKYARSSGCRARRHHQPGVRP